MVVELGADTIAFLALAALLAGAINSVAGGGSLVSFPALLLAGYPPVTANATNIVAVMPGYLSGSVAYRRELRGQRRRMLALGVTSAAGAVLGSVLLVTLPAAFFQVAAPFLVLGACALLAARPLVERRTGSDRPAEDGYRSPTLHLLVFAAAVYGGYFGAALGIMLLAVLGLHLADGLQRVNALKAVLSLVIGAAGAAYLVLFGPVVLLAAAIMAVGALAGGQLGVVVARRLRDDILRWTVIVYGVAVAVVLLATG